ncbi:hypothetical protein [Haloferax massiliensis]|uniref:hypothetical protein n=1 Tax=Haloferax massiliensis TaxID=1476858 RepID=UPI001D01DA32|nr:hypothetical protein [Haloferax massiliensis]
MKIIVVTEKYRVRLSQKGHVLEHVTGGFSIGARKPMSTTHTTTQERTVSLADQLIDALARSFTLGVDAEGFTHHYFRPADAVVVFDGRTLDHYQSLDGRPLREWKAFVSQKRGWDSMGQLASIGLQVDTERKETPRA